MAASSVSGSWRGRAVSESPIQTESKPAASARSAIASSGAVSGWPDMIASRVGISTPNWTAIVASLASVPSLLVEPHVLHAAVVVDRVMREQALHVRPVRVVIDAPGDHGPHGVLFELPEDVADDRPALLRVELPRLRVDH